MKIYQKQTIEVFLNKITLKFVFSTPQFKNKYFQTLHFLSKHIEMQINSTLFNMLFEDLQIKLAATNFIEEDFHCIDI